ncbi:hypothetical protein MZM54_02405 [[Brevibacterium] frigoritolerans]|nr:hypothetical protein [Peribacillus frigoritolerans]
MNNLRIDINNGERLFSMNTDLLIAKRSENDKELQILAASFYETKSELNKMIKKNSSISATLTGHPAYENVKFTLKKFSNFEKKETSGKYHTRVTLVRKKDAVIDQTQQRYPIVMLPKTEAVNLQTIIFEYVRDNIVSPLFPDVRIPQVLAGELFIPIEKASEVLNNVKAGILHTSDDKIASEMLDKYYEWANYTVRELAKRNRLQNLEVIACPRDVIAYELIIDEEEIREIISNGLKSGWLQISKNRKLENHYDKFDTYMPDYSSTFKQRIESISKTEHKYGEIRVETKKFLSRLGRSPISVQEDVIEAGLKSLRKQKRVNIVGDPGVGKTFMMSSIAFLDSLYSNQTLKALVLSPDHLIESAWQNEVETTLTETTYHHITSVIDLIHFERAGYFKDAKHRVFILPQGVAKSGYSYMPMVRWETRLMPLEDRKNRYYDEKVFVCPHCGDILKKRIKNPDDTPTAPKYIEVPVGFDHFATERYNNRKCGSCQTVLWGTTNKKAVSYKEFVSGQFNPSTFLYTKAGFLPNDPKTLRKLIEETRRKYDEKPTKIRKAQLAELRAAELQMDGTREIKAQISPYKVPVADYIFKKLKNVFTHLIIDEVHEIQNGSSVRTQAAGKLISSVPKIITGTGTMMNGYAKSLFYSFFMLYPEKMKKAGFEITDSEKFQVAFGVTEKRFRLMEDNRRKALAPKSKPGISPVIFAMFLQDTSIFISIDDLSNALPSIKTDVVEVEVSKELLKGKEELELAVLKATGGDVQLFKTLMPTLYSYLDMPTVEKEIKDEDGNVIYRTKVISNLEDHKIEKLKSIVRKEVVYNHNRVIVYTYYTSDGINDYIKTKLEEEGYKVTVLNKNTEKSIGCDGTLKKVQKKEREAYIKNEVSKGTEVLICNPELVKTGTNLIAFAPIVRYQMDYQVYTERQARGRTRRIGQTKDCTIYYLYYKNSFQEDITKLMATKIVASEAIEGKMDARGLDAITNSRTPEEELAKKFFEHMGQKKEIKKTE